MLLLRCMLIDGTWDPLRKLYFVLRMFGSDSSNQKPGWFAQLTYSSSNLPFLACTILQE